MVISDTDKIALKEIFRKYIKPENLKTGIVAELYGTIRAILRESSGMSPVELNNYTENSFGQTLNRKA